jgi:hypothetical protein
MRATPVNPPWSSESGIAQRRDRSQCGGVHAGEPVPPHSDPNSPVERKLRCEPGKRAWERTQEHDRAQLDYFNDIQEERPLALRELEVVCLRQ